MSWTKPGPSSGFPRTCQAEARDSEAHQYVAKQQRELDRARVDLTCAEEECAIESQRRNIADGRLQEMDSGLPRDVLECQRKLDHLQSPRDRLGDGAAHLQKLTRQVEAHEAQLASAKEEADAARRRVHCSSVACAKASSKRKEAEGSLHD
eukprot:Polyplicarium_translucidae@DN4005_c0_g1_i1.p1